MPGHADRFVPKDTLTPFVATLATAAPSGHLGKCQVLVTPDGRVHRPCALTLADLGGPARDVTLKVTRNKVEYLAPGPFRLRTAVVETWAAGQRLRAFDVVELVSPLLSDQHPDSEAPVAVMWSRPLDDKSALAAARAGTLPAPAPIADRTPPSPDGEVSQVIRDDLQAFESVEEAVRASEHFQQQLADGLAQGAVVLGSGPSQRWKGRADAKALSSWKLDLTQAGGIDVSGGALMAVGVSHFVGKTAGEQPTTLTYVALVVNTMFMLPGGSMAPRLALVKLAIAQ